MSEAGLGADDRIMNENQNPNQNPDQNPLPPPPSPSDTTKRRLTRSSDDKMIGGVAGGLARHLDVDPALVRLAFVLLAVFGGSGLLLYALAWMLIPSDLHDAASQGNRVEATTRATAAADPTDTTPSAAVALYTPI